MRLRITCFAALALFCATTAALLIPTTARAVTVPDFTVLRNGDFEMGLSPGSWFFSSVSPGALAEIRLDPSLARSGLFLVSFESVHSDDFIPTLLSQLLVKIPGASYILSFAINDLRARSIDEFKVTFGNFSTSFTGDQAPAMYVVKTLFIDSSLVPENSFLDFTFSGIGGKQGDGTAWLLDDVSLTPVITPLPTTLPLFATGLGALALLGWRRTRKGSGLIKVLNVRFQG